MQQHLIPRSSQQQQSPGKHPSCNSSSSSTDHHHGTNHSFEYLARVFLAAGISAATATAVVNPMELIKTRMQTIEGKNTRMLQVAADIVKKEGGVHKLWTIGLGVSFTRSLLYSSFRMGLYDPIKDSLAGLLNDDGDSKQLSLGMKAFAGLISGAVGSALMNPLDVVKIRFQSSGITGSTSADSVKYKNTVDALWKIARDEGFTSLYKGTVVTMVRASILTAAQLASYDHSKYLLLKSNILGYTFSDNYVTHVSSALVSGLCTAIAISPVDVIKTKYMNDAKLKTISPTGEIIKGGKYNGVIDCVVKSVKTEGYRVLLRGFLPSYARLCPHFLLSLPLYEQFRKLFGVSPM